MIIIDFDILQSLNSMNYPKNNSYFQHGYFIKRGIFFKMFHDQYAISLSKFIINSIFEYIQNLKKRIDTSQSVQNFLKCSEFHFKIHLQNFLKCSEFHFKIHL